MGEYLSSDDAFFIDNMHKMNKFIVLVLGYVIPVGPLFAMGTLSGLFKIEYIYCLELFVISIAATLIQYLTNKFCKNLKYVMVQGFVLFLLYPTFIFLVPNVGVSIVIGFAIIPFLSCLYLSYKFTIVVSALSYICMAVSLYVKSYEFYLTVVDCPSPDVWFFAELGGYSMISVFVLLGAINISRLLNRTFARIHEKNVQINNIQSKLINAFADTVEFSDPTTNLHVKHTSQFVNMIAKRLRAMGHYQSKLTEKEIDLYTQAAPLHDIGKFSVPTDIITKPGKYTVDEYEIMKKHAQAGHDLIESEFSGLQNEEFVKTASQMAWYHHEKWDGTGYPRGIKGNEIPLCGRIMAAADVLDALLSRRLYKEAYEVEKTFDIMESLKGTHFEPCIVDAVLTLKDDIVRILEEDEDPQLETPTVVE